MKITSPGQRGFLIWVQRQHPKLYNTILRQRPGLLTGGSLSGLGLTEPDGVSEISITAEKIPTTAPTKGWIDSISQLAQVYLTTDAQKKLWDLQIQQAKTGGPPLDLSQYQPGVNVGIEGGTQKLLLIGGAVLAAVYLLPKLMKR